MRIAALCCTFVFALLTTSTDANALTVTTTADSGAGSLRQAILDANATNGLDTIAFNIPGPGVHTITPGSVLPTITDPVVIDGYTQPGATNNTQAVGNNAVLLIELNGSNAGVAGITGLWRPKAAMAPSMEMMRASSDFFGFSVVVVMIRYPAVVTWLKSWCVSPAADP